MKRIGIFGESECGKTTLAKVLSREFWNQGRIPTLALDPQSSTWGNHAWTTADEEKFRQAVKAKTGFLVVIEDASETIQRDREFTPFFTAIRHQLHHLMVIGHDGTDLLPTMRRNVNELYLFLQTEGAVKIWQQDQPSMLGLDAATKLKRFEFIHCLKFSTATKKTLAR